jgi:predicted Fe-Mo cluster-binding NifX family protein
MKIAVPVTINGLVDEHFGHCEYYNIYTISENNEIQNVQSIKSVEGCGCKSNIAHDLAKGGVTMMLAGGIGGGAINVLNSAGIEVVRGCSGNASEIVKQYIAGLLSDSGESCQQHEHHHGNDGDHVCKH